MQVATPMAIKTVRTDHVELDGRTEIDIKRFAKVEKSRGVQSTYPTRIMLNKVITHSKMKRKIDLRILSLD